MHLACTICGTPKAEDSSLALAKKIQAEEVEKEAELTRKLLHEEHMKEFAKRVRWGEEGRPWNKPGATVSSTRKKEYRKIQVIIGFGWLCFDPRGHMTILDWYDRNLGHPLTEFHVRRVQDICNKYRRVARKGKAIGGVGNNDDNAENSFLFDPESD